MRLVVMACAGLLAAAAGGAAAQSAMRDAGFGLRFGVVLPPALTSTGPPSLSAAVLFDEGRHWPPFQTEVGSVSIIGLRPPAPLSLRGKYIGLLDGDRLVQIKFAGEPSSDSKHGAEAAEEFNSLLTALTEKYGKPIALKRPTVGNSPEHCFSIRCGNGDARFELPGRSIRLLVESSLGGRYETTILSSAVPEASAAIAKVNETLRKKADARREAERRKDKSAL